MKLAYYPGCSLDATAVEYSLSTQRVAAMLGVELTELEDWNCCGATSAHSTDQLLSLALPARNLAIAEQEGLDVLAPCAACYNRFRAAEHRVRHDAATRQRVQQAIGMDYRAENETLSILELLAGKIGIEAIAGKVTRPLKGMRPACYYGCLLVRPVEHTGFDDAEYPQSMENIMRALGARPVEWSHQVECCGASLVTSRPEIGLRMTYEILRNARAAGADSLVTACPLCQMNLDMRQAQVEKAFGIELKLPVYYVTELLAFACGDTPQQVGMHRHFVEAVYLITHLPEEPEEEPAETKKKAAAARKHALAEKEADEEAAAVEAAPPQPPEPADCHAEEAAGPAKAAAKLAAKVFPEDADSATVLTYVLSRDGEKLKKMAQLLAQDKEKALKVAEAMVKKEAKARGEEVTGE
ncbi:MAG: CoB--CoM heterodisulfide reductase iron-sulfur subunit B family protein [Syntrophomonadaceae bacterium]|nr:CoB--CoM heterodisulfide reductase iron-sulfur subunit B family protein [Syntrophomonadaceae bacterium]